MLDRIRDYLANTSVQRDALEAKLQPLRERHRQAILDAEARHRAAMDALPLVYISGRRAARYTYLREALRHYAAAPIIAAADARLSAELEQAERDYRAAAEPLEAEYYRATAAVGSESTQT